MPRNPLLGNVLRIEVCSTFLPAYNNYFVAATAARSSLLAAYLAAAPLAAEAADVPHSDVIAPER